MLFLLCFVRRCSGSVALNAMQERLELGKTCDSLMEDQAYHFYLWQGSRSTTVQAGSLDKKACGKEQEIRKSCLDLKG